MLGVILCGGDSTRMGRDKGMIPAANQTWAGSAAEKVAALGLSVAFSINDRQLSLYTQVFSRERLIPDDPTLSLKGPLCGVLSAHFQSPADDLFILACDLPLMELPLLNELCLRRHQCDAQAYLYTSDGEPEPLCGIYSAAGLALIAHLYHAGQLVRHSMKYVLDQLIVDSQPVPVDKKYCFQNFNYPSGRNESVSESDLPTGY